MRALVILAGLLFAGCCSGAVQEATLVAARDNVGAWETVRAYISEYGIEEDLEDKAAKDLIQKRARAFYVQAQAIVAGLEGDGTFDAAEAYRKAGEPIQ